MPPATRAFAARVLSDAQYVGCTKLTNCASRACVCTSLAHPDGLVYCSLRLFDLPPELGAPSPEPSQAEPGLVVQDWEASVCITEGETIYDYAWYPFMSSEDPATCVFASTARVRLSLGKLVIGQILLPAKIMGCSFAAVCAALRQHRRSCQVCTTALVGPYLCQLAAS